MPKSTSPFPRRKSSSSSTFSAFPRKKTSLSRQSSKETSTDDRLNDLGLTPSLAPPDIPQDVLSLIHHIQFTTWEDIPEVAGMNSVRIAEILRYRGTLPPIISLAHLYALSNSPTETEREFVRLVAGGVVRKVIIPGRTVARGGGVVAEGVVVVERWRDVITRTSNVDESVKKTYMALMDANPTSTTTSTNGLGREEIQQLVRAGFLTNPTAMASATGQSSAPSLSSLLELSKSGSSAPTGSLSAIGGRGAVHEAGGGGSALSTHDRRASLSGGGSPGPEMTFSLPNTGVYLKLLTSARAHLVTLLKQLSPRFNEATLPQLKEKWDGNVLGDSSSTAKRARGEWTGVLAGRTKKWKDFHGLRFEAVLGECVGCGMVEVFETGIGISGVRAR
ncbi:hypothetical protein LTR56_010594 [Elasticomyces elasticus]|nr:hypothetical protein LTR56_010594 [Elasticomyces elasticus]KAK3648667.1 hypothetical protein LTR22_013303 [Elasticomyces elasticus]KAK4932450.1 hypothetical protein LTR49_001319 [Elasticomyces elasticus]KAK5760151.1 hypothetical protein LTS12_009706 [Elasticomyces elasticus]